MNNILLSNSETAIIFSALKLSFLKQIDKLNFKTIYPSILSCSSNLLENALKLNHESHYHFSWSKIGTLKWGK